MAEQRKIKCDCGAFLKEDTALFDSVEAEAMVCPSCKFTTLTKDQARKYVRLKELHDLIDTQRRIIKIGNSMGITFPDKLQQFGVKVGKTVKLEVLSQTSFKIELEN